MTTNINDEENYWIRYIKYEFSNNLNLYVELPLNVTFAIYLQNYLTITQIICKNNNFFFFSIYYFYI